MYSAQQQQHQPVMPKATSKTRRYLKKKMSSLSKDIRRNRFGIPNVEDYQKNKLKNYVV